MSIVLGDFGLFISKEHGGAAAASQGLIQLVGYHAGLPVFTASSVWRFCITHFRALRASLCESVHASRGAVNLLKELQGQFPHMAGSGPVGAQGSVRWSL